MKRHVREGARSGTAGPENGGETVKKYTLPLVMWAIFETIAIILWLTKNNIFSFFLSLYFCDISLFYSFPSLTT